MPRTAREAPAGVVFHVLNRGVGKRRLFLKDEDYAAFERVLGYTLNLIPIRLFAYCLMPNHWHLLLSPTTDEQLGQFMQRLTITHARRWKEHYGEVGHGHLYQGRFKSFPVETDEHFLTVARYVERNPLRAGSVRKAQNWPWSSLRRRVAGDVDRAQAVIPLAVWPVQTPNDWLACVNTPQTAQELELLHLSVNKGRPYGSEGWQKNMTRRLNLASSYRGAGRPRKNPLKTGQV